MRITEIMRLAGLGLLLTIVSVQLNAQNCTEKIFVASKLLEAGKTQETIEMVYPCTQISNQESSRWQACRLLVIAFQAQGKEDSARKYGEQMLELNPSYTVNPLKDPKSMEGLLSKIVVMPRYTFGLAVSAGSNITIPSVQQGYVVADYNKTYRGKNSSQFGTNLGFYFSPRWKMDLGLLATTKSFAIDYGFDKFRLKYSEKLTYLELPVTVKYILRPGQRLRFFGSMGFFSGRILFSDNSLESFNIESNEKFSLNNFSSMERRIKMNYGLFTGLGIYYKLRNGQFNFETNYYRNLRRVNNATTRYAYSDLVYNYYYADDDLVLHNLTMNVGYSFFLKYKIYHKNR